MKKTSKNEFTLSLLGYPVVPDFGNTRLPTQKAQALLYYLVTERILHGVQKVPKEKLVDLFWMGMPATSALQNLRQTLYQIRKTLTKTLNTSSEILLTDRKSVWISETISISSDLDWYAQKAEATSIRHTKAKVVLEYYDKPFLENFHLPNAPLFDEWIEQCRKELRGAHISKIESVVEMALANKNDEEAVLLLAYLIRKEPYVEQYHFKYLKTLLTQGKRNKAIQQYQVYQEVLQKELGLSPSPVMEDLFVQLQESPAKTVASSWPTATKSFINKNKSLLIGSTALTLVILLSALMLRPEKKIPSSEDYRIAILPMENYTQKEYLSDGITDDVLIELTKVEGIKMISRQSTSSYKDTPKPPTTIGKELQVNYLLKGSIAQINQQYKVSIQFLETATAEVLWADAYVKDTGQIFALQGLITQGISHKLNQYFNNTLGTSIPSQTTQSSEAYNAYLKGKFSFYQADPEALHTAVAYFKQALEIDPAFNTARAWLAWSYCSLAGSWGDQSAQDMYAKVQQELVQIENDQELQSMYLKILGWMHFWLLDRKNAEYYLKQAVAINPNEEFGLSALGMVLTLRREFDEAEKIAAQGLDLNPHFFWNHFVLGQNLYYEGNFEEALQVIDNGLSLFDNHQASIGIRSRILSLNNTPEQAIQYLESILKDYKKPPASTFADLGLAYVDLGNLTKAEEIANLLLQRHAAGEKYTAYFAAKIFSALNNPDKALELLEDALRTRDNELNWVEVDLEFSPLHNTPRFQKLLQALN